ncbi:MAG: S8 family serine peptidase [Acidimicrobiales bacterium]
MAESNQPAASEILLAKIRPSNNLFAAAGRVDLEPLYERSPGEGSARLGLDEAPQWFMLRVEPAATPWDQAHTQVAHQLGIDESDVLFAEPDLIHDIFTEGDAPGSRAGFALDEDCQSVPQDNGSGKPVGDGFAWHLGSQFTQLGQARDEVSFSNPRTRVAHIDTGFYPAHETTPTRLNQTLDRNFVRSDDESSSAVDPDNDLLVLDNSGHGTGTLSILAGGPVSAQGGAVLGGAPQAEIVPIRVADSVVLLRTSSLARAIRYAADIGCAVASLSMGGLPSKAWAEAVDDAYLAGLCLCAAAGNHPGPLPPKRLVYPARYDRVIAVAGVMANGEPYKGLHGMTLEGSFGPKSAMKAAMAAYTPNIPWARFGCRDIVRLNGEGTSSATPQVAAAAALWIEKHKDVLRADWRRVEAVRHALFSEAKNRRDTEHLGHGILQARDALAVRPDLDRPMSGKSDNSWAFLRLLTGLGIRGATPTEEMLNLEFAQRWLQNEDLQEIVPDPDGTRELTKAAQARLMDAVIEDEGSSLALRRHMAARYSLVTKRSPRNTAQLKKIRPELPDVGPASPEVPNPPYRRLRVYAKDPSLSSRLATSLIGEVTLDVPWEPLELGRYYRFEGEYLAIDDKKPDGGGYHRVDLSDERLLAQDGWEPSEGNAQFHQQMVYAVASKTIEHFERALGRPLQWRPKPNPDKPNDDSQFLRRLEIRPHALQTANAYYSPTEPALLFGYFPAPAGGQQIPGSPVYTCLSHDIIAHETTHAILDGIHRRFHEPTNPDVLAFHEGFADLVALLQQFEMSTLLEHEINRSGGDLEAETLLGTLAIQVGTTARGRHALRSAIGSFDDGEWIRATPDPDRFRQTLTPHARGAVLVGAVFDALLAIYESRTADLVRIATGGSGLLPDGAIHPDLARRLAREAAKSARHVLGMCIRALDYLPPVDVTFHDFLRALITADFELVSDDKYNYRVAFVEAFARRGIFPGDHDEQSGEGVGALSADTLRWAAFTDADVPDKAHSAVIEKYEKIVALLRDYADKCLYIKDREELFKLTRTHRIILHGMLKKAFREVPEFAESLGLADGSFEVHALRRALRARVDGRVAPEVIVSLTQSATVAADDAEGVPKHTFRGGSTLVVDLTDPGLPKYRIVKHIDDGTRRAAAGGFASLVAEDPLRSLFFSAAEPFAALHELAEAD